MLVDLAAAAGAFLGALGATVNSGRCLAGMDPNDCHFASDQPTARAALVGGGVGLTLGWLVTRNFDKGKNSPSERHNLSLLPVPTALAVPTIAGGMRLVPALAAQGQF
jgi:hypothetical protein